MAGVFLRGKKIFETNLNREIAKIKGASAKGIFKAGLYLQGKSKEQCPNAQGNLVNSSFIASDLASRGAAVYVGYHAVYAMAVHENPRSGKTGGFSPSGRPYPPGTWARTGNWKYLENPLKEQEKALLAIIKANVRIK